MKNNEWNIPSDYFEKNKKALMPVRKFPTGKWLLALAAACVIGVGFFMWKGKDQNQEIAQGERREDIGAKDLSTTENIGATYLSPEVREGKNGEDVGAKNLSPEEDDVGAKYLSPGIAEGLKEIPREELVAYLLEEDSELIENIN